MVLYALTTAIRSQAQNYQPNWESIDKRPTPQWFDDAKFGIIIHWGLSAIPAFADPHSEIGQTYAEWYWYFMQDKNRPGKHCSDDAVFLGPWPERAIARSTLVCMSK